MFWCVFCTYLRVPAGVRWQLLVFAGIYLHLLAFAGFC